VLTRRTRTAVVLAVAVLAATLTPQPATAAPDAILPIPTTIALPNGFQPEGIAIAAPFAYFGSRADGRIYRASLFSGQGAVLTPGPGTPSLGLKIDARGRLFVAGGTGGDARVIDTATGRVLASYRLQTVPSFINDVILAPTGAWYTDSTNPVLFNLPLGRDGSLPPATGVRAVPLTGDIVYAPGNNANGIALTPDGRGLLIVQSNTGLLFRVDPATGRSTKVDLGTELLTNGDGLLVIGSTLYVVQNRLNTVAVFRLNAAGTRGELATKATDARFDVPTTVAAFGDRLYLPNARFTTPPTPDTTYSANAIRRPL
jgi:sugar lactone lactonase YvrE